MNESYQSYATAAIAEALPQEAVVKYSICERFDKTGEVFFVIAGRVNGGLVSVIGENSALTVEEFIAQAKLRVEQQNLEAASIKSQDDFFKSVFEALRPAV